MPPGLLSDNSVVGSSKLSVVVAQSPRTWNSEDSEDRYRSMAAGRVARRRGLPGLICTSQACRTRESESGELFGALVGTLIFCGVGLVWSSSSGHGGDA